MRPVVLLLVIAACDRAPSAEPSKQPPIATTTGVDLQAKQSYDKLCAPCHAADLRGGAADHAPSLANPTFLESATDTFLFRSIVLGRPGTSMGAYGKTMGGPLDDAAVTGLVRFIRRGTPAKSLAAVAKGDPGRGAPLYVQYCRTCHGDTTMRGEAPHLANVQFQKLATDSFVRFAVEKGRPGTKMQAFAEVLQPQQMDDVVAYIRALGTGMPTVQQLPAPTGKEPLVLNPKGKDPVGWKPRDNRFIGVDDVAKALADKRRLIIIDARPPSEWMRVHIDGAVSIPYHDMKRLDEVPKDVYVIAYCACPHHLSGIVVDELVKRGYKKALVLDEGINVWHQKSYPVVAAPGVQAPPLEAPAGKLP